MQNSDSIPLKALNFLKRQQSDWKVTVIRMSIQTFLTNMLLPYLSIYIIALGATATQLGIVNSVGMFSSAIFSLFTGWLIDRNGPKTLYLFGIGAIVISYLTYALAQDWTITIVAMCAYWLGYSISINSCATICGNCLTNADRATGMMVCEIIAAGLLGLLGPVLGAWIVAGSGGVAVDGIRPVFYVTAFCSFGSFILVLLKLSNRKWHIPTASKPHLLKDLQLVLKKGKYLKRWLIIASIQQLPMAMIFPFAQLFAHQFRGADEYLLGLIVIAGAVTSLLFAVPVGRLADRFGRKKLLFILIPLFWISNIVLVLSPDSSLLILVGAFQGFYFIGSPITAAMERELVSSDQMGRWTGMTRFFKMVTMAVMTLLSGFIWDAIGPQYVFLLFIGIELIIRIPLLITMPETLNLRLHDQTETPSIN